MSDPDVSQLESGDGSTPRFKAPREQHAAVTQTSEPKRQKPEPPKSSEAQAIERWTADLNDILARANQPMLNFLGALSVKLRLPDVRYTMAWNAEEPDPRQRVRHLVQPAATVREWVALNRDVGETLLSSYLESVAGVASEPARHRRHHSSASTQAFIGNEREHDACFDLRDLDEEDGVYRATEARTMPPAQRPPVPQAAVDKARAELDAAMRELHEFNERERRHQMRQMRRAQQRGGEEGDGPEPARDKDHEKYLHKRVTDARNRLSAIEVRAGAIDVRHSEVLVAERGVEQAKQRVERAVTALEQGGEDDDEELAKAVDVAESHLEQAEHTLQSLRDNVTRQEARSHVQEARNALKAASTEMAFAPAWAWECMGSALWRRFVSVDALAAIQMAHTQVNRLPGCSQFSVKELVCSHEVHDQFAFLVAYNYLSTSDTMPGRKDGAAKQNGGHMTYLNIEHLRRMLAAKVLTCHVWFETHVRRRPNPLLAAFDKKREHMMHERPDLREDERWQTAMKRYRAMMPSHELICVEPGEW
jgi:hypothetical protein